jgi:drug/metabolite transporter (DMT)-like permease
VTGLAVGLALLASMLFAVATAVQHRAAVEVPDEQARGLRLLRRLLRSRRWWAGVLLACAGYAAHAAALGVGSLLLVQPLLIAVLLFALPLSARWSGRRMSRSDWCWSGLLAVALAAFLLVGRPTAGVDRAPARDWLPAAVVLGVLVAICLGVATVRRGTPRALLLAVATGVLFGAGAALTKGTVTLLPLGLGALFGHWELYALVVVMAVGGLTEQSAFQAGHLQASLPAVTVGEPVIAALLGATVLRESLAATGAERMLIAVLVVVMAVATIALARSAARMGSPLPDSEAPVTDRDASRSPRS